MTRKAARSFGSWEAALRSRRPRRFSTDLPSEDGDIFAVKAGPEFELLFQNSMGELLTATPAISDGMMFVRAHRHVFAIGRQARGG